MPTPTEAGWWWWRPLDRTVFFAEVDRGWRPVYLVPAYSIGACGKLESPHFWFSIHDVGTNYLVGHPEGETKWEWGPRIPEPERPEAPEPLAKENAEKRCPELVDVPPGVDLASFGVGYARGWDDARAQEKPDAS